MAARKRKKTPRKKRAGRRKRAPKQPLNLDRLSDKQLLAMRICDLPIRIEGSWIEGAIKELYAELETKGLKVRPHFWLSDEWFCPEGIPGVAIPFFLAHPRLMRLERKQMLEVEGSTRKELMRLLRHETGHAVDHAYRLHQRRGWQRVFGKSSQPYPDYYRPNPASKRFVLHLDHWYAQAHPDEDFAETFAVWLTPNFPWRKRYDGWPALRKLEYVDELMKSLFGVRPEVRNKEKLEPLSSFKLTLAQYYERRKEYVGDITSDAYDRDLRRLFAEEGTKKGEPAAAFLRRNRREIRKLVAKWTGEYEYSLDILMKEMIERCRELKLRAVGPERQLRLDFAILLTARTMAYIYHRREWHSLV